ncbi:MAG TPA: hypothetical protein VGH84_16460 [Steroidobacteraceae bacterium]|jgi:hypothetical protein
MIIGLSLANFTLLHVIISLIGIASGLIAVLGLCGGRLLAGWTALFLLTTVATSVTGFMFPSSTFGPPQIVGVISLIALAIALSALYLYRVAGPWRWIYAITAVLSLYLNMFVGVAQAFDKIPALHPLAPTGSEPPFKIAQAIVLIAFIVLAIAAVRRFHPIGRSSTPAYNPGA